MAISEVHFNLLCDLRLRNVLPENPRILEIGQATYYGDMDPKRIIEAAKEFQPKHAPFISNQVRDSNGDSRALVKLIYGATVGPQVELTSIDPGGDEHALKHDLNERDLPRFCERYNLLINHGTAEHIFDIANVFQYMHDNCEVGGIMIHEAPWTGWVNHGFYCLQPTLFYDVARENNYRIEVLWAMHIPSGQSWRFDSQEQLLKVVAEGNLPNNLNLFVALRRLHEREFKVPNQGVYTPFSSNIVRQAWLEMR